MGIFLSFSSSCSRFIRSEEHTSELQSRGHLVCRLLLEKKKSYLDHALFAEKTTMADQGVKEVLSQVADELQKDVATVINQSYDDGLVARLISRHTAAVW